MKKNSRKILVTGASGFLGSHLCKKLEAEGHQVVKLNSKNADLRRPDSLAEFGRPIYDQIYHLAAWTQAGDFCLHHPGEQWIINQQINTNMLTWWQQHQPQAKLICMGTSCAYDPHLELREENYMVGRPIDSLFTYAMTKRMLYAGCLALQKQYGMQFLHLIPSTLYGPDYHTNGRQMHFIFDLMRKIIQGKMKKEPVILWGDGHQKRELVYVDDFVNIAIQLSMTCKNDLINIGAGEEFPIRHFAQLICEKIGYNPESIQYDTSCYVGAKSKCLEIKKLQKIMPQFSLTPLREGLAKTADWFTQQNSLYL